jgi:hypothetical protein
MHRIHVNITIDIWTSCLFVFSSSKDIYTSIRKMSVHIWRHFEWWTCYSLHAPPHAIILNVHGEFQGLLILKLRNTTFPVTSVEAIVVSLSNSVQFWFRNEIFWILVNVFTWDGERWSWCSHDNCSYAQPAKSGLKDISKTYSLSKRRVLKLSVFSRERS